MAMFRRFAGLKRLQESGDQGPDARSLEGFPFELRTPKYNIANNIVDEFTDLGLI